MAIKKHATGMKLDNIDEIEGIYVIKIWIKVVTRWMKLDDMDANQPIWMMTMFLTNAISSMSHFIHWIIKSISNMWPFSSIWVIASM
jgi:hypothetical protein